MGARIPALLTAAVLGLTGLPATAAAPDLRETRVRVRASAVEAVVLTPVTLTGRVNGDRRTVELEIRDAQGWRRIDRTRTDELGAYTFEAPTRWYGKKRLRVVAPATRTHESAKVRVAVRVQPEYTPVGDPDSWRNFDGRRRYNPCEPVLYAVNPSLLPPDGMAVLQEALFRIEKASGLRHRYAGTTSAVPFRTTPGRQFAPSAHLTVAWSTEAKVSELEGTIQGLGGYLRTRYIPEQRTNLLLRTGLVLDAEAPFALRGFEDGSSLGVIHMSLLGSAMGLGQVAATDQVMHRYSRAERPTQFGHGDLNGMSMHGLDQGCLERTRTTRPVTRSVGFVRR